MSAASLVYLLALAVTMIVAFWDAPARLVAVRRRGRLAHAPRYHVANAVSVLVGAAWLVALRVPGIDRPMLVVATLPGPWTWMGMTAALAGFAVALWARYTMGRGFLPTAGLMPGQAVVSHGPFSRIRHPFYAGMWIAVAAGAVALDSLATGLMALALVPILQVLAIEEERFLVGELGKAYLAYARGVPRFIPGLPAPPVGS